MLDIEAFTFLNRALESTLAPIVILATNRGYSQIRGTDINSPHGLPVDLLDRLLIIRTTPYNLEDIIKILAIRAQTEGLKITEEALQDLSSIGNQSSLRFAILLLTPANILAQTSGREEIAIQDIQEVHELFLHAKQSAKVLEQQADKYIS
ncbi:unnamed protein product (macronuclear) [Paramecium tetraurelia]|uniref:RuvB-like helicase n=1 Tax=Paramecium tetraurelia TaxID=5888 RepID=A0DR14_PARTE|nr:uncharacterized protein GSPATT00002882001 [Paramecium tetraurelia]CAK85481.1 unnamed protein product [Paramecium tetraurelia]|eukprot:XP_001452878.1 hypothetical protein (macronuclear) [Paramecium tetraurelia strain d4-2]